MFRALALATKTCKLATLDNYKARFKERCSEYPSQWAMAMSADVICRTELWARIRSQQKRMYDDAETRAHSSYDPTMPWECAVAASINDSDFWGKHFERPALRALASGTKSGPIHADPGDDGMEDNGKKRQRRGGRDHQAGPEDNAKRADGRYHVDKGNVRFCRAFHDNNNCRGVCKFSHSCEYCRGNHRSTNCKQNSGGGKQWHEPKKGNGKGKQQRGQWGQSSSSGRAW